MPSIAKFSGRCRGCIDLCHAINGTKQFRESVSHVRWIWGKVFIHLAPSYSNTRILEECWHFIFFFLLFLNYYHQYTSENEKSGRKLLKNVIKAIKGIKQAFKRAPRYKASMITKVVKFCTGFNYDTKDFRTLATLEQKISTARKQLNKAYDAVSEKKLEKAISLCRENRFNGTEYVHVLNVSSFDLIG